MRPVVSVLMSVYNAQRYLKMAVESVLAQTFKDFEFLIIDDCSQDGCVEIVKSYQDPRIRLVKNENNLGQTRSLNKGLALALGRYIARMDADDYVFPRWLEKNLAFLNAQPSVDVVSSPVVTIDSENRIQKRLYSPVSYDQMFLHSLTATPLNHVGAVYKTRVIVGAGGYDESFKIAADFDLWSKLMRNKVQLASGNEILAAIRVHEKSASAVERGRADFDEITRVMTKNFDAWVSFVVSSEDIALLWKLQYATDQLSVSDFQNALSLLSKAYENIKPQLAIPKRVSRAFFKQRQKVFYGKRALGQIAAGQLADLRTLAQDYQKLWGYFNIFTLLWLGSWLGRPMIQNVPSIFKCFNQWQARQKIKFGI